MRIRSGTWMTLSIDAGLEKSSWLGAPRGVATSGHWRQAKCRLTEDGALCQLKVYVDVRASLWLS